MAGVKAKFLALIVLTAASACGGAETWRIDDSGQWKAVEPNTGEMYLLRVAEIKKLVDAGQAKKVRKAAQQLKKDYPETGGKDFDAFMEGEILLCRGKLTKASRQYDKFMDEYPASGFKDAAMARQFEIGTAYLGGRKKQVLIFSIKGYDEGVKVMEKVADRGGNSDLARRAAVAVAQHYEKRKKYEEAYLKWSEVSSRWPTGETGKDALLGMAKNKYAQYNGSDYDASSLISARSYYENFRMRYPEEAAKQDIEGTVKVIDERIAAKQAKTGQYYERMGSREAANLYYQMVLDKWPQTQATKTAQERIERKEPEKKEENTWLKAIGKLLL
jgi:outer membrane protein assembly factor BamD (BamD/ComL family)